jgi:hypothetical protein
MIGRSFAPVGYEFPLFALCFHFQRWLATFLLVLSVDDSLWMGVVRTARPWPIAGIGQARSTGPVPGSRPILMMGGLVTVFFENAGAAWSAPSIESRPIDADSRRNRPNRGLPKFLFKFKSQNF